MKQIRLIMLAASILYGCGTSSYGIRVIDGTPKEVYLTFAKGTDVKVGDTFVLYRLHRVPSNSAPHSGHGGHSGGGPSNVRQDVGRVRVVAIADDRHALVIVLVGGAEEGLHVEKLN